MGALLAAGYSGVVAARSLAVPFSSPRSRLHGRAKHPLPSSDAGGRAMNSYFEQSGFYNGQSAAEQSYRFPQGLLVPPYPPQRPPANAAPAHESPTNYAPDAAASPNNGTAATAAAAAACKLYSNSVSEGVFKPECLAKDQNGFNQAVKEMWPGRGAAEAMRPFPADNSAGAPRVTDAWSTCCQSTPPMAQAPANAFYPWMAIAGWCK